MARITSPFGSELAGSAPLTPGGPFHLSCRSHRRVLSLAGDARNLAVAGQPTAMACLSVRLAESGGWRLAKRWRVLDRLIDAGVGLHPQLFRLLVDLTLADDEARVQPPVAVVGAQELHPSEDGPTDAAGGCLLDALPVHGDEDLCAVVGPDHAADVWRPHAVLSFAGVVGPTEASLDVLPGD